MSKDIREQYEKEFEKWVKEGQPPVVVAWTLTEKILDSQKEEWVNQLRVIFDEIDNKVLVLQELYQPQELERIRAKYIRKLESKHA